MSIHKISRSLSSAGVLHHVVIASDTAEELYWLKKLATRIRNFLNNLEHFKPIQHETIRLGEDTKHVRTFKLLDMFNTKNPDIALQHLGVLSKSEKQKTGNRTMSVLYWLMQTRIALLPVRDNGGVEYDATKRSAGAYFNSQQNLIGIPAFNGAGVLDLELVPPVTTLVHELEHARDFYITGYHDGVPVLEGDDKRDFDRRGKAYYLDLPETKARCKELALSVHETFADRYQIIKDANELIQAGIREHNIDKIRANSYRLHANKTAASMKMVLRNRKTFSDWLLSPASSEFTAPMPLPRSQTLLIFNKYMREAYISKENEELFGQFGSLHRDHDQARMHASVKYMDKFIDDIYKDLCAQYAPVIRGVRRQ